MTTEATDWQARALDKPGGNTLLSSQAMDYLKRHGLNAEITR